MPPGKSVANANLLVLIAGAWTVLATTGLLVHAANRIVPGKSVPVWAIATTAELAVSTAGLLGLVACSVIPPKPSVRIVVGCLLGIEFACLLAIAGHGAATLAIGQPPAARTSLGPAFWFASSAFALMAVDLVRSLDAGPRVKALVVLLALAVVVGVIGSGGLDGLSIVHEYRVRADMFDRELGRHVALVVGAAGLAVVLGLPLGFVVAQRPVFGRRVLGVLGVVQTIPSIALFGLLISPLSDLTAMFPALRWLGISGIGPAPAIVALVLYGLLPIVRNTATALRGVPASVIDAALGSGMRPRQVLLKVSLPLAAPLILSGFRIVLTQTIGLTVIAALIGAGGLGTFVFMGLGQNAIDLIMLGVVPTVALALAADALAAAAVASFGRSR